MHDLGMTAAQVMYLFVPLLSTAALSGLVLHYDLSPSLKRPIDGGVVFRGRRLFGDNKTWRSIVWAILGCTITVAAQKYLVGDRAAAIAVIPYEQTNVFVLGMALGLGAVLGELPNSFIKRQLDIAPGHRPCGARGFLFFTLDQVDLLLATWPILLFWVRPDWPLVVMSFVVVLAVHPVISSIGYLIGARQTRS